MDLLFRTVGPDRCLFGTERPGTGSALDPKTNRYLDDIKPLIDGVGWLTTEERQKIFEDNARTVFNLTSSASDVLRTFGGERR